MKIKDLCESERPREKLLSRGADSLSNGELLAILIGSGSCGMSALETAQTLLSSCGGRLSSLFNTSPAKMGRIPGIGPVKACSICAALELGRRFMAEKPLASRSVMASARTAYENIIPELKGLRHEECWVMLLNRANFLLRKERISSGSDHMTVIDSRQIVRLALENNASGIILVHNHPGGNPRPSAPDLRQTELLHEAAKAFDISLVDHIIVCDDCFFSVAEDMRYEG